MGGGPPQSQQQQLALKDVQCPICLKVFSRKFSLEMHFLIHQGLKPYKCQFCGRCFRQKGTLMRHKLMCVECGKLFGSKALYRYHAQLHLAVQGAFRCPQCRLRFARKPQLLQHTRQCHLRRLRCPRCGRLFSYRCLLASHARHCPGPAPPPLCLPVVDIEAARGALGPQLLGVIPLVAPDGDEPSPVLGVPVLAPDSLLKNRLNGLHVSARIGL
ncbi:zinc finger protein, putative [Ixodes scapularis]|uniref:Zinc finger protein, putative n=1 Tax=Ixodes scapularis TaxID=6945 RepID=B7PTA8_IXOSC|nr:zinc finger protein, putative [Ixodes scapularis]|eukprot:XP_002404097.1 zinc finger protein, putative [Ixodes scapularis]